MKEIDEYFGYECKNVYSFVLGSLIQLKCSLDFSRWINKILLQLKEKIEPRRVDENIYKILNFKIKYISLQHNIIHLLHSNCALWNGKKKIFYNSKKKIIQFNSKSTTWLVSLYTYILQPEICFQSWKPVPVKIWSVMDFQSEIEIVFIFFIFFKMIFIHCTVPSTVSML